MNIGDIKLKNGIVLAPMAGVTDLPFRLLCKQMGADIVYTEFVSSNGIIRESKKTFDMIKFIVFMFMTRSSNYPLTENKIIIFIRCHIDVSLNDYN